MDQSSLVMEQIDDGETFIREFTKYKPVQAAFWLKLSEDDPWYLYIASDEIDDTNFDLAYGEVSRIASRIELKWLSPFEIKVLSSREPLAAAVIDFQQRFPGRMPKRYRGQPLGNMIVEEVYMYPQTVTTAA
jgi:hypothetical protein